MIKQYFNRYELKYLLDVATRDRIISEISPFCRFDDYAIKNKGYKISSLYFDSDDMHSYFEKVDGERLRRKLRIRFYPGSDGDSCFAEIKQKNVNNVVKRRIQLPLDRVYSIITDPNTESDFFNGLKEYDRRVLSEIWYMVELYHLKPKIIISYLRIPFEGWFERRFRVTFDSNIQCRRTNLRVENRGINKNVLDPRKVVMEVKFNSFVPFWMVNILNKYDCSLNKISKYCAGVDRLGIVGSL